MSVGFNNPVQPIAGGVADIDARRGVRTSQFQGTQ